MEFILFRWAGLGTLLILRTAFGFSVSGCQLFVQLVAHVANFVLD